MLIRQPQLNVVFLMIGLIGLKNYLTNKFSQNYVYDNE